jgi:hypothetical protein
VNPSQDIVQSGLGEGEVLVDRIKVVRVDAGDELVDDPVAFGVWERLSLILHYFNLLIFVIINLRAERSFLLDLKRRVSK